VKKIAGDSPSISHAALLLREAVQPQSAEMLTLLREFVEIESHATQPAGVKSSWRPCRHKVDCRRASRLKGCEVQRCTPKMHGSLSSCFRGWIMIPLRMHELRASVEMGGATLFSWPTSTRRMDPSVPTGFLFESMPGAPMDQASRI